MTKGGLGRLLVAGHHQSRRLTTAFPGATASAFGVDFDADHAVPAQMKSCGNETAWGNGTGRPGTEGTGSADGSVIDRGGHDRDTVIRQNIGGLDIRRVLDRGGIRRRRHDTDGVDQRCGDQ